MAEYIEREAVKAAVRKRLNNALIIGWLISIVNEVPAADVVPVVHGRWSIRCETHRDTHTGEVDEEFYLECSECKRKVWDVSQDAIIMGDYRKAIADFPYCHCGARMDGAE